MGGEMATLTLQDQYRAVQAIGDASEVFILDYLWTTHLEKNATVGKQDLEILGSITHRMLKLLESSKEQADWANELASNVGPVNVDTNAGFFRPLNSAARDTINKTTLNNTAVLNQLKKASSDFPDLVILERENISRKLEQLSAGSRADGDISHETACLLRGTVAGVSTALAAIYPPEGIFAAYQIMEIAEQCF